MRLSNRHKAPYYNFLFTILNMILAGGVICFLAEIVRFNILGNMRYLLLILPVLLLLLFVYRGKQIFEYDSDGEAINFKNRNIIPFSNKVTSDEFPKYKVIDYRISNLYIVQRLYVTISSKRKNSTTLQYDISYLTRKEISDLKVSLNKVLKNNRERVKSEITQ